MRVENFSEGQRIQEIEFPDGFGYEEGENGVDYIYITMEPGQESYVPWAVVVPEDEDMLYTKVNLAHVQEIHFDPDQEEENDEHEIS
jgi:hypothetical protein